MKIITIFIIIEKQLRKTLWLLVLENDGDEDEAIAALLHDAVEDQGGAETRAAILKQFGERVVEIVDGCTEPFTVPRLPWRDRKLQYISDIDVLLTFAP